MTTIAERLREQPLPGEAEAAARSWPVVEAALAGRESAAGRSGRHGAPGSAVRHGAPGSAVRHRGRASVLGPRRAVRLALVCALAGAGLVAALTPAGAEVGDWIGDRFAERQDQGAPAFVGLPPGGSVLAISGSGAYAVHADGSSRRLGSFSDAGWSPRGLHVVGVDGRRVIAVNPVGTVKWTIARPGRVHHPAWSLGEGYAVTYLEGDVLRVVAGDGTPATDRALRGRAAPVTPAWRPGSDRILTYATAAGAIETIDVVTGATVWRTSPAAARAAPAAGDPAAGDPATGDLAAGDHATRDPAPAPTAVRELAWTRDGRRVVALSSDGVTILSATGRTLVTIPLPGVSRELAVHPSGRRAAIVVTRGGQARVLDVRLPGGTWQLFQGDVHGLAWSQDGRHLLLAWRATGQWLVIGPGGRMRALHDVSRELGAAGGFPRVAGWCCPG